MVVTIIAIILGLVMAAGGVVPNVANGMLQSKLDEALNHPEYLRVQVHPEAPSFTLLGGDIAYTEIDAKRFTLADFPVEELQVHVDKLSADTSKKPIALRQPTQGVARVRITQAGLNRFLQSDTFRTLLDGIRKRQSLASQLDADLTDLSIDLQADKIVFKGQAATMGGFFTVPFELSGRLRLGSERQLFIQDVQANALEQPISSDVIAAVLAAINPVLDLQKQISTPDMQIYFRKVSVTDDYLEFTGEAELKKLPG